MNSYQNILVGINYTDASRHALWKANRIALQSGAKVTAYHAVPPAELNEFVSFYMIEHTRMMHAAKTSLEDFVSTVLGDEHQVASEIGEGVPHHELVSYANEHNFDLLVLGDDDYANDTRKAGQFAVKCLRFAKMPVLLVNEPEQSPTGTISACIDFSNSTDAILEHAAKIASGPGDTLEIVHACRPPWLRPARLRYQTEVFENKEQMTQFREILEGQLNGIKEKADASFEGEVRAKHIESEDPTGALLDHFKSVDTKLIIIGRAGKGFKGLLTDIMGGTAETIIRHAHCPVLVIPVNK